MSYSTAVNALSPVAYWRLGESSGTTAFDETANNHDGTYTGSGFTLGTSGLLTNDADTCVSLDGVDGSVEFGDVGLVTATGATITLMFQTTTNATNNFNEIMFSGYGTDDSNIIKIGVSNVGGIAIQVGSQSTDIFGSGYSDGNPHHLVILSSGATYVDGSLIGTYSRTDPNFDVANSYSIGQEYDGTSRSDFYTGDIDEVALFSGYLSTDDINELYQRSRDAWITGTGSATLPEIAGTYPVEGTASGDITAITATVSGSVPFLGTGAGTLSAITATITTAQPSRPLVLILDGSTDNKINYEYLLKSFRANRYDSTTSISRFTFQCPKREDDITAYNNRPNGQMILYKDGQEIFRVDPEYYSYNEGPESKTLSIKASKNYTNSFTKTVTIEDTDVGNVSTGTTGKRVFTIPKWIDINPLDSILYKTETIQIEQVSIAAKISGWTFTLTEI